MKRKIEQWLRRDDYWKEFINISKDCKDAVLINMDIITIERENETIYFDVSIVYFCEEEGQKQVIESGIATIARSGIFRRANI